MGDCFQLKNYESWWCNGNVITTINSNECQNSDHRSSFSGTHSHHSIVLHHAHLFYHFLPILWSPIYKNTRMHCNSPPCTLPPLPLPIQQITWDIMLSSHNLHTWSLLLRCFGSLLKRRHFRRWTCFIGPTPTIRYSPLQHNLKNIQLYIEKYLYVVVIYLINRWLCFLSDHTPTCCLYCSKILSVARIVGVAGINIHKQSC